jgi:hypothetical protein
MGVEDMAGERGLGGFCPGGDGTKGYVSWFDNGLDRATQIGVRMSSGEVFGCVEVSGIGL